MAFYFPQEIGPPPPPHPHPVPSRSLGAGGTSFKVNSRLERRRSRFMEQPFPFTYRQKPSRKLKSKKHNFERNPFSLSGKKKNYKPRPPTLEQAATLLEPSDIRHVLGPGRVCSMERPDSKCRYEY